MQVTLPKPPKIKEEEENRAVFVIEDLYPGYGVTIGNALRRVLYSSLPGAAITQVKIKGVPHEFSTLSGVLEDILEITLNLKQVYVRLHGDEPQTVVIKAKGSRKITAGDIDVPSQVEIVNKDAYIATLTSKNSQFEAELLIEAGLGYIPVEQQQIGRAEIGAIPLDAIFTPMRKVNFEVENMRVGDKTDYDRLRIEVITNGTISPQEAFEYASKLLLQHFEIVGHFAAATSLKKAKTKTRAKTKSKAAPKKSTKTAKKLEKKPAKKAAKAKPKAKKK